MNETRMWKRISLLLLLVLAVCAVVVIGIATMVFRDNGSQVNAETSVTAESAMEQDVSVVENVAVEDGSGREQTVMSDTETVQQQEQTVTSDTETDRQQEETTPGEPQVIYSAGSASDGMISIDTKYCTLLFPEPWSEHLTVQETGVDEANIVTFYCSVGEDDVVLYNVYFNASNMGEPVGYITVDGEKIPCSIEYSDYVPDDWSEERRDTFYGMAECINDIIDSIRANDGFSEE